MQRVYNKLTSLATVIRSKTGKTDKLSLDAMRIEVEALPSSVDTRTWELTDDGVLHIYDASLVEADYSQDVPPWFNFRDSFHDISFEDNITSIGRNAFSMSALTSLTLPKGVTSISSYAFGDCGNLTEVIFPDTLVSIGDQVFNNCYSLTEITIPNGVVSIGQQAFASCPITELIIPSSVTSLGFESFLCCDSLITVTIPTSVTQLNDTFMGCLSLEEINYAGTMEQWNSMELSGGWYDGELVAYVTCSDGQVCVGEHEWDDTYSYNNDSHWLQCKNCDIKVNEALHDMTDMTPDTELEHFCFCVDCDYTISEAHKVTTWFKEFSEDGTICTLTGFCETSGCDVEAVHTHIKGVTEDCPYCDEVIEWPDNVEECQHNWIDATCTDPRTCEWCGETEGEALGHDMITGGDPGCLDEVVEYCQRCDYSITNPAIGHNWVIEYDQDGAEIARTCNTCGETEILNSEWYCAQHGHNWGEDQTDGTNVWHVCEVCGETESIA